VPSVRALGCIFSCVQSWCCTFVASVFFTLNVVIPAAMSCGVISSMLGSSDNLVLRVSPSSLMRL